MGNHINLNNISKCIEITKSFIDIYDGRDAKNNAILLYSIIVDGPKTSYELMKETEIGYSVVNRRLRDLSEKGYVGSIEKESSKKGKKIMYWPTFKGISAAAFLDIDENVLKTAEHIDDTGGIISKKYLEEMLKDENKKTVHMETDDESSGYDMPNPEEKSRIPNNISLQLKYMIQMLPKKYFETRWGKELLQILTQDDKAWKEFDSTFGKESLPYNIDIFKNVPIKINDNTIKYSKITSHQATLEVLKRKEKGIINLENREDWLLWKKMPTKIQNNTHLEILEHEIIKKGLI